MKKTLAIVLAIIMTLSVMVAAIPVSAAAPIEAIPYSNWTINGAHFGNMQKTLINPLGFTNAKGISIKPWDATITYSVDSSMFASKVGATIEYNSESYPSINGVNSIILYVKTESANTVMPVIEVTHRTDSTKSVQMSLADGSEYYYAALGDSKWTQASAGISGHPNESQKVRWATVDFAGAFEGYIKIPFTSLSSDTYTTGVKDTDTVSRIVSYFRYGGVGYGNCVVGPAFFVTSDSTSTKINVPDEYKTAPIEATPLTGWTINTGNWDKITRTQVSPLGFTTAGGLGLKTYIHNSSITVIESENLASTFAYGGMDFAAETAPSFGDATHVIVYVELPMANTVLPTIETNAGKPWTPAMAIGVGDTYQYAAIGDVTWSTATAVASKVVTNAETGDKTVDNKYWGAIQFDSAFKGYIKFALEDLINDSVAFNKDTQTIAKLITRFRGIGEGYGNPVVGPYFLVTSDSTSTKINVPDEFKPAPMEATPITGGRRVNYNSQYNVSTSDVTPLETFTTAQGIKVTSSNGSNLSYSKAFDSKAIANYLFKEKPNDTDTYFTLPNTFFNDGIFMLYVKTDKANEILPTFHMGKSSGSYNLGYTLGVGKTYSYAALGDTEWTEVTVQKNGLNNSSSSNYGVIEFDGAFEGYIKIPYFSLLIPAGEAGTITALGRIEIKFLKAGVDAGDTVVGPFFYVTKDTASTKIIIPDEYKPAAFDIKEFNEGNVRSRSYTYSTQKVEKGYKLFIDESVFSEEEHKYESGDSKWTYVENDYTGSGVFTNLLMYPEIPLATKDIDGFMVYLKTDAANEYSLIVEYEPDARWEETWNPSVSLKPGTKVSVLANGADKWETVTVEKGGFYGHGGEATAIYGKIVFDKAFEGYIKIPFSSLGSDDGWAPYTTIDKGYIDRIVCLQPSFKGIGGSIYGEVVTDILGYYTFDTPSIEIGTSEDVYESGDVNNDCFINANDLVELTKYLLGQVAEFDAVAANINGDAEGKVDILDFIRLKKELAKA